MKLSVIGLGNMGQALVRGFVREGLFQSSDLFFYDADVKKATSFSSEVKGTVLDSIDGALDSDYILLAVKPQVIDSVLEDISGKLRKDTILISIAAAVTIKRIRKLVGDSQPLVRVMPNTPALVGAGVSALCFDLVSEERKDFVTKLFSSCGIAFSCTEPQLDAVGSVSGTGPAYLMLVVEALSDAAVKLGLPRDLSLQIAAATVYGAGKLALESGFHPAVLKDQVCSPGGTTIEGVIALEKAGVRGAFISAVEASDEKTKKMAGG